MNNLKLSIITVNLNNAVGLRKTIESILSQSFTDYEYLVIDGGSTDGSIDIIKEYANKITYWVSEPDKGIYNAMNKGILLTKGEYLQFLNSGDWLVNNTILTKVLADSPNADILYGDLYFWETDQLINPYSFKNTKIDLQYFYKSSIAHPASFIKRTLFEDDLYDENFRIVSDWKFFLKKIVLDSCSKFYLDSEIVFFDVSGISSDPKMQHTIEIERKTVLKDLFSSMVLSNIEELYDLNNLQPVRDVLEIQKLKGFRSCVFRVLHITLKVYKKIILKIGHKI